MRLGGIPKMERSAPADAVGAAADAESSIKSSSVERPPTSFHALFVLASRDGSSPSISCRDPARARPGARSARR